MGRVTVGIFTVAALAVAGEIGRADTIQLVNGDRLQGQVTSLDGKQLVFHSPSFGDLKIDRSKIELIALGNKGLPEIRPLATVPSPIPKRGANGDLLGQVAPLLQNPAVQQQLGPMIEQLLGAGGTGDLQKNINDARRGLQDLKKDLGEGGEGKALDAYINLFNFISPPAAAASPARKPSSSSPAAPPVKSPNVPKPR
jgi:hypothetical protein